MIKGLNQLFRPVLNIDLINRFSHVRRIWSAHLLRAEVSTPKSGFDIYNETLAKHNLTLYVKCNHGD